MTFAKTLLASIALVAAAFGAQAAQTHQYRFDGTLADDFGGPALTASGGTLGAGVYTFDRNQGLTLGVDLGAEYTVDLRFQFDTLSGYQKIVDFKSLAKDVGMYTLHNALVFFGSNTAGSGTAAVGTPLELTLTRDAAGIVNIYKDRSLIQTFDDASTRHADFTAHNANFFIDDFATGQGEAGTGSVNYIRTFDTALSATEVGMLGDPVAAAVPEPGTWALMLAGLATVGAMTTRRRRG